MSGAQLQTITAEVIRLDIAFIISAATFLLITLTNRPLHTRGTRVVLPSLLFNNFNSQIMDYFLMICSPQELAVNIPPAGFSQLLYS